MILQLTYQFKQQNYVTKGRFQFRIHRQTNLEMQYFIGQSFFLSNVNKSKCFIILLGHLQVNMFQIVEYEPIRKL